MTKATYPSTVFMIVAHNHPELLGRLVAKLQAPWSKVLVAIDAKSDQRLFEAAAASSATFLRSDLRVDVRWGGIGLTTAAVRMMSEAIRLWSPDRFCMLSGVDYPIKPIEEIGRGLSGDVEFVRVDRRLDPAGSSIHDVFVRYRYFNDLKLLNPRSSPVPKLQRIAHRALRLMPRSPIPDLPLYHGCGWWCITRLAAEWVLSSFEQRPDLFRWLKHTNCPDEIFVQTLLKASPFAALIAQDLVAGRFQDEEDNLHGCHYIDWHDGDSSSPKTLDLDDLLRLGSSSALFARKIDPIRSAALLDALDTASDREDLAGNAPNGASPLSQGLVRSQHDQAGEVPGYIV